LEYQAHDYEPILTGKELCRFKANPPQKFIHFAPELFQQVAPVHKYRAPEQLLYNVVSNQLVFSYDDRQLLSLSCRPRVG